MNWHPYAERFPLLDGAEREALKESIKATQGVKDDPVLFRVVDGQMQGLDGRNRFLLCKELRLKPALKRVKVKDEDVKAFIIRKNITRRHLTPELRQALVIDLREEGQSTRAIAETLGVSQPTVVRDLEKAGDTNVSPDEITGKDGKIYSPVAPTPAPRKMCRACRTGVPKVDCPACEAMNTPALREPGDDTESEAAAKKRKPKNKSGALYDWKKFEDAMGILQREIVNAGKPYNAHNTDEAQALGRELIEWKKRFKEWHKSLKKGSS